VYDGKADGEICHQGLRKLGPIEAGAAGKEALAELEREGKDVS
jgi:hypothetical protein